MVSRKQNDVQQCVQQMHFPSPHMLRCIIIWGDVCATKWYRTRCSARMLPAQVFYGRKSTTTATAAGDFNGGHFISSDPFGHFMCLNAVNTLHAAWTAQCVFALYDRQCARVCQYEHICAQCTLAARRVCVFYDSNHNGVLNRKSATALLGGQRIECTRIGEHFLPKIL